MFIVLSNVKNIFDQKLYATSFIIERKIPLSMRLYMYMCIGFFVVVCIELILYVL